MFDPGVALAPHARCRVQVFSGAGLRSVALVTQACGEGLSLINGAEAYARAVWLQWCPDEPQPPLWIQRFLEGEAEPRYLGQWVTFKVEGQTVTSARFRSGVTAQEMAELVGVPVDEGRGNRADVEVAPEPQRRFEAMPVMRLPRPNADADRACRPAGISGWQAQVRQWWPRRGGRDCCWYHGGDWHEVSAMATDLLREVRADGDAGDADALAIEVVQRAGRAGWDGWRLEALRSLFFEPIQFDDDEPDLPINGRHRTQAMLEAGVRTTVAVRWRMPA